MARWIVCELGARALEVGDVRIDGSRHAQRQRSACSRVAMVPDSASIETSLSILSAIYSGRRAKWPYDFVNRRILLLVDS
jgi:hypothetical protein